MAEKKFHCTLELTGSHGRLIYTNLKGNIIDIPTSASGVTAFCNGEPIPIKSLGSMGSVKIGQDVIDGVVNIGQKIYRGENILLIVENKNDNIEHIIGPNFTWINRHLQDEWIFEEVDGEVTIHAVLDDINWKPHYNVVLSEVETILKNFSLSAVIQNNGSTLSVDKIIFKSEDTRSYDFHSLEENVVMAHSESLSVQLKSSRRNIRTVDEIDSVEVSAVARSEGVYEFIYDAPIKIEKNLTLPIWKQKSFPMKTTYTFNGKVIVYNILLEKQKFSPYGRISIYNYDMTHLGTDHGDANNISCGQSRDFEISSTVNKGGMFTKTTYHVLIKSRKTKDITLDVYVPGCYSINTTNNGEKIEKFSTVIKPGINDPLQLTKA